MKLILYFLLAIVLNTSCNSSKNNQVKNYAPTNRVQQNIQNAIQKTGVDYVAEGNIPTQWSLKINVEDTVYFYSTDGNKFAFAYHFFTKTNLTNEYNYTATSKAGNIKINIKPNACQQAIENAYNDKVTINFNNKIYEGCGKYLKNTNIINNWILYKINNEALNTSAYKTIPSISFNAKNTAIIGNDGCVKFKGIAELQGDKISFTNIKLGNNLCNSSNIQKIIEEKINNRVVTYFFKNNDLVLYLIDDSMLYFKKN
jgi:META domain